MSSREIHKGEELLRTGLSLCLLLAERWHRRILRRERRNGKNGG